MAINGGLLGLEGIIQRLEGSGKLLFLVRPHIHKTAATQFGPYAYYANASQYFNLLWPVCLGFWWMLHRSRGFKRNGHHVVLVCCAIMAACPIISTSRGGTLITVGMLVLATPLLLASHFLFAAHQPSERTVADNHVGSPGSFLRRRAGAGFLPGMEGTGAADGHDSRGPSEPGAAI